MPRRLQYGRGTARIRLDSSGCENLTKPNIRAAIKDGMAARIGRTFLDQEAVIERLLREADYADQAGARVRAIELLGKHLGMMVDRSEVGQPGDFDAVPDDELREEAQALGQAGRASKSRRRMGMPKRLVCWVLGHKMREARMMVVQYRGRRENFGGRKWGVRKRTNRRRETVKCLRCGRRG